MSLQLPLRTDWMATPWAGVPEIVDRCRFTVDTSAEERQMDVFKEASVDLIANQYLTPTVRPVTGVPTGAP